MRPARQALPVDFSLFFAATFVVNQHLRRTSSQTFR
jgi:hypothetical protein